MRRRSFLVGIGAMLLLAGCSEQPRRIARHAIPVGDRFAVADIAGRAAVIGIGERAVTRLFELGMAASDVTWARWSPASGGAVLALVVGNGPIHYWMADRAAGELRPLPGSSDAGDAVALGGRVWQIGPGSRVWTRTIDDRDRHERRLPIAIPTRVTVSGGRVFVLGQTKGRPMICEVSETGDGLAVWRIPRSGQVVDLAVIGSALAVSIVPDVTATGSDQASELLILDASGVITARHRLDDAGLATSIGGAVVVVDSRAGARFVIACDPHGTAAWEQKLPSEAQVLTLTTIGAAAEGDVLAIQEDAVSVVSATGVRRLPLVGRVISQG